MLIVVRPSSTGQGSGAPSHRRSRAHPSFLTDLEAIRLPAAFRTRKELYGSLSCPAVVLGIHARSRRHTAGTQHPLPAIARRTATADRCRSSERGS